MDILKKFIIVMLMLLVVTLSSCRSDDRPDVDSSKTQLNVFNFDGGYGTEWLRVAKERFEETYKDEEFEEGKKGIQIQITPQKENGIHQKDRIKTLASEVFFNEYVYYDEYIKAGLLLDISDVYNDTLPGESKTLKEKLTEQQLNYYKQEDGKFYAVPHYAGYSGLVYNIDFFDEHSLYFKEGWTDTNQPFTNQKSERTKGPDQILGTDDDGLPTTYEEFYVLCNYIVNNIIGAKPLIWNGIAYVDYLKALINSLYVDNEGPIQFQNFLKLEGEFTTLVDSISNGEVTLKDPVLINSETNGNLAYGQAGKYYGTDFVNTIIKNKSWYDSSKVFAGSYSHLEAQKDFLYTTEFDGRVDYAMLIEGIWWENETDDTITKMVQSKGQAASKYVRNFGWMPLPRKQASEEKQTLIDHIYSAGYIKSNIDPSKIPAAIEFLKFVNTDESLIEFTKITNTPKALQYTLSDDDKNELSNFGRSIMNTQENSNIVYPFNNSMIYKNNIVKFSSNEYFKTNIGGTLYAQPIEPIRAGRSTDDIFDGYLRYGQTLWEGLQ